MSASVFSTLIVKRSFRLVCLIFLCGAGGYVNDKKCPYTGTVSVRDRVLAGTCHSAKMQRTIIVRRNDLHFVNKYQRYEKRHSNIPAHVSLCFRLKEGLFATLFVLAVFGVATAAAPVSTIHSPDGDVIDCINKLDQPALKHPLLKNHLFQETPTDMVKTNEGFGLQVWHANGASCPDGTIPIRRFEDGISHRKQQNPLVSDAAERATKGHEYAIAYTYGYPIYGAKATLNVWKPIVESGPDFSLAQIWIRSGEYKTNDINTVEAGWTVYPSRYNDSQPRLFTYWTRDAYLNTGCYGTHCGFVHVSSTIALEVAINQASTFGGDQFDITIQIWKDRFSGNWWMAMGLDLVPVGYWPAEIFTTLFDHATMVQWGGEVYRNTSNTSTILQMGSGEYPEKGFRKAAYFCNIEIAHENRTLLPAQDFHVGATHRDYYTIKKTHNRACGTHFYYGGPGPVCSASVPGAVPFTVLLVSVFFVVLLF